MQPRPGAIDRSEEGPEELVLRRRHRHCVVVHPAGAVQRDDRPVGRCRARRAARIVIRDMATMNGTGYDEIVSTAHGASARCLARAVVVAFDACDEAGIPMSELQRVTLVEAALREFDGFGSHLSSLSALGHVLRDLRAL